MLPCSHAVKIGIGIAFIGLVFLYVASNNWSTSSVDLKPVSLVSQMKHFETENPHLPDQLLAHGDPEAVDSLRTSLVFNPTLQVYTLNGRFVVWTFWDYAPMPAYISLSLETLRCQNAKDASLVILNESLSRTLVEIPDTLAQVLPAQRVDYIRCSILLKYGGIFVDADSIQLWPIAQLFRHLKVYDILGYTWSPENAPLGTTILGPMRANTKLMEQWKIKADKVLSDKINTRTDVESSTKLYWSEILTGILNPIMSKLLAEKQIRYLAVDGLETYGQLTKLALDGFLFDEPFGHALRDQLGLANLDSTIPFLIYHNNEIDVSWKNKLNITEFLEHDNLFGHLIKLSLNRCYHN